MAGEAKLSILIAAKDQASKTLDDITKKTEGMQRQMKIAGTAMVAAGAAITGALAMCVKSAAQEEAGMMRLRVAAENVGIAYDVVEDKLEKWIDTMQQKTSIADDAQRDSLASLIRITRDVAKAQDLLALAMDVAVGTGRDLASATTLLMYALSGNWGMLERYIPAIKEAADEEAKWMLLRKLFKGQAEEFGQSMAGQYELLKNNISDIKESIGTVLLPVVTKITAAFNTLAQSIKSIPAPLIEMGTYLGLAIGTFALLTGSLLLAISQLGHLRTAIHAATAAISVLRGAMLMAAGTTALLLGQIGLVIGVLAGVGYASYKAGQAIGDALSEGTDKVYMSLESLNEMFKDMDERFQVTKSSWTEGSNYIVESIERLTDSQKDLLAKTILSTIGFSNLTDAMKEAIGLERIGAAQVDAMNAALALQGIVADEAAGGKLRLAKAVKQLKDYELAMARAAFFGTEELREQAIEAIGAAKAKEFAGGAAEQLSILEELLAGETSGANKALIQQKIDSLKSAEGLSEATTAANSFTRAELNIANAAGLAADSIEMMTNTAARARAVWESETAFSSTWEALKERTRFLAPEARAEYLLPMLQEELTTGPMGGGQTGLHVFENYVRTWLEQLGGEGEGYGGLLAPGGKYYQMWLQAFGGATWAGSANLGPIAEAVIKELLEKGITPQGFGGGGIVPGPVGRPMLATVHGGEMITPPGGTNIQNYITIELDGRQIANYVIDTVGKRAREARVL